MCANSPILKATSRKARKPKCAGRRGFRTTFGSPVSPMSHSMTPPHGFFLAFPLEQHAAGATFAVGRGDGDVFVCKRLSERARADDNARHRLVDEGRILEALGGRGAPAIVARGEDAAGPFVVMRRIAMPTLEAHARTGAA